MRTRTKFLVRAFIGLAIVSLYACGGGSGSPGSAIVSAYVTDDLGGYDSVVLTLNSIQLHHTSGRTCEIIHGPLTVDAAELGHDQVLDHVDTTACEAGPYNRLHVELDDDVTLSHTVNNQPVTEQCKFVSYYDDGSSRPNRLACSNGNCSLDVTGAVNLVAGSHEHVALDADLKEFTVAYTQAGCEVTLKVSPLHASEKIANGYRMRLTGFVSNLNTTDDRFTLTVKGSPYLVVYAGVTDQTGIDQLLQRAAGDQLKTRVRCETIDYGTSPPTCSANSDTTRPLKAITVQIEGTISALNESLQTFTLGYGSGATLPVNYAKATELGKIEGTLADDAQAEAKLFGFSLDDYLAREIEVKSGS